MGFNTSYLQMDGLTLRQVILMNVKPNFVMENTASETKKVSIKATIDLTKIVDYLPSPEFFQSQYITKDKLYPLDFDILIKEIKVGHIEHIQEDYNFIDRTSNLFFHKPYSRLSGKEQRFIDDANIEMLTICHIFIKYLWAGSLSYSYSPEIDEYIRVERPKDLIVSSTGIDQYAIVQEVNDLYHLTKQTADPQSYRITVSKKKEVGDDITISDPDSIKHILGYLSKKKYNALLKITGILDKIDFINNSIGHKFVVGESPLGGGHKGTDDNIITHSMIILYRKKKVLPSLTNNYFKSLKDYLDKHFEFDKRKSTMSIFNRELTEVIYRYINDKAKSLSVLKINKTDRNLLIFSLLTAFNMVPKGKPKLHSPGNRVYKSNFIRELIRDVDEP